jgi:DGQHR domain-containing protein
MSKIEFSAAYAQQSPEHCVLTFAATAKQVLSFSTIERITCDQEGEVSGFQRPQVASHIREIKDYLSKPDAVLPNAIVVAFIDKVEVKAAKNGICKIIIDTSDGPPGLVVDGQQRLSALSQTGRDDFQLFVSVLICKTEEELRRQFVLINNTKPLPKSLIYELLPTVDGLPDRMQSRSVAAELTSKLNYLGYSSLKGMIYQHTNPAGVIRDTAVQKVMMNSLTDGIMRELVKQPHGKQKCVRLTSEFYKAVQMVFPDDWKGHTPKTSRLVHGAGIQALGYVMETLAVLEGARTWEEFAEHLGCLRGQTAWTSGTWDFGDGDTRHWKAINVTGRDIMTLAKHLDAIVIANLRAKRNQQLKLNLVDTSAA